VPGSWDEMVWDCVYALLMQDAWPEEYLNSVEEQAEQEIRRIQEQAGNYNTSAIDSDTLRQELRQLAAINLEEATFEEKRDIINKLGIMVYPSEDFKTMQVKCGLKLTVERDNNVFVGEDGCGIVLLGEDESTYQGPEGSPWSCFRS
jgi:hypothetical protein